MFVNKAVIGVLCLVSVCVWTVEEEVWVGVCSLVNGELDLHTLSLEEYFVCFVDCSRRVVNYKLLVFLFSSVKSLTAW